MQACLCSLVIRKHTRVLCGERLRSARRRAVSETRAKKPDPNDGRYFQADCDGKRGREQRSDRARTNALRVDRRSVHVARPNGAERRAARRATSQKNRTSRRDFQLNGHNARHGAAHWCAHLLATATATATMRARRASPRRISASTRQRPPAAAGGPTCCSLVASRRSRSLAALATCRRARRRPTTKSPTISSEQIGPKKRASKRADERARRSAGSGSRKPATSKRERARHAAQPAHARSRKTAARRPATQRRARRNDRASRAHRPNSPQADFRWPSAACLLSGDGEKTQVHTHTEAMTTAPPPAAPPPPPPLRVADHFPTVVKSCEEPAARFFHCFSNEGQQRNGVVSVVDLAIEHCTHTKRARAGCRRRSQRLGQVRRSHESL